MSERVVVVRNPVSTRSRQVERNVIDPLLAQGLNPTIVETEQADAEANIAMMRQQFRDNDTIMVATGDGTKMQATNAVLREGLQGVRFGMLPYGNYNDFVSRGDVLNVLARRDDVRPIVPMKVDVNGEYLRHVPTHMSIGTTALVAGRYDDPARRETFRQAGAIRRTIGNLALVAGGYLAHRREHLPPHAMTPEVPRAQANPTDMFFLNHPVVGGLKYTRHDQSGTDMFDYVALNMEDVMGMRSFWMQAAVQRAKVHGSLPSLEIAFDQPSRIPLQSEGELTMLDDVSSLSVKKSAADTLWVIR